MNDFLTLEDVNGACFNNQHFWWHEIDTANISTTQDFSDVKYDFCEISRQTVSENAYNFTFKVHNSLWTKYFALLENQAVPVISTGGNFKIQWNKPSLKLKLYMGLFKADSFTQMYWITAEDTIDLNYKELNTAQDISVISIPDNGGYTVSVDLVEGYNEIRYFSQFAGYLLVNLVKSDFQFNCTQTVVVGTVNKVKLGVDSDYKPNGDMIGEYTPDIFVDYNGENIPVYWDNSLNDYCFDLDLTDKQNKKVKFNVNVKSNKVLNTSSTDVILQTEYQSVSSASELIAACKSGGSDIIQLANNINLTSTITIEHSIKIIGNFTTINMSRHSFNLNEGVEVNIEKTQFNNADTCFIQSENSTLKLTECTFTNCTSNKYNELGSCIFCDVDLDNLEVTTDFITEITNCTFIDNQSAIFHGGELTVSNCKLHNTDLEYINKNNPAFLYQTDGAATIQYSIFDIDYDSNTLCENEKSLGYAQCLVKCGETAQINGANYIELGEDDKLPFFNAPFNNQSHIFAKYYYPQIESCVYLSPILGFEDKSVCYCVTGVDWIFKQNVQVTRASWDSQNEIRKIRW